MQWVIKVKFLNIAYARCSYIDCFFSRINIFPFEKEQYDCASLYEFEDISSEVVYVAGAILEKIKQGLQNEQKLCITCDYPNYAGKLIMMKYKIPVSLAGKTVMFNMTEEKTPEITALLIKEGISIFGINTITKSLEDVFSEILQQRNKTSEIK